MQKTFLLVVAICIFIFFISACQKDKLEKYDNDIWKCHQDQEWSASKVARCLYGKWKWQSVVYYWEEGTDNSKHLGLSITFKRNHQLEVCQDGDVITTAIWSVKKLENWDEDSYELVVEPSVGYLHGVILICDNTVMFNDTPLDGAGHTFVGGN